MNFLKRGRRMTFALLFLLAPLTLLAQNYPHLNGAVADGLGKLNQTDVQAAADRLSRVVENSKPIALLYDASGDPDRYEKGFLEANEFGMPGINMNDNVVLIAINYHGDGSVKIRYGNKFAPALDGTVDTIERDYVFAFAGEDLTRAFTGGFDAIGQAYRDHYNPKGSTTTIDTKGLGEGFWKIAKVAIPIIVAILLGWLFMTITWPAYKRRTKLIELITKHRADVVMKHTALSTRLPSDAQQNASVMQLCLLLNGEGESKEAETWTAEFANQREKSAQLYQRVMVLNRVPVSLFADYTKMETAEKQYTEIEAEQAMVASWLNQIDQEASRLQRTAATAPDEVEAVKRKTEAVIAEYGENGKQKSYLPESGSAAALLTTIKKEADDHLTNRRPLKASDAAKRLNIETDKFATAVSVLMTSMTARENRAQMLEAIFKQGFFGAVMTSLKEADANLAFAQKALVEGKYEDAQKWAKAIDSASKLALEAIQKRVALHDVNNSNLEAIAGSVAVAEKKRTTVVAPKWKALQSYKKGNWQDVAEHFEKATKILASLFDDPKNEHDVASEAARLNSLQQQKFEDAEKKIASMKNELARTELLMQELEIRHEKTLEAEKLHDSSLKNASVSLELATKARDDHDEWITSDVDTWLVTAKTKLNAARKADTEEIFVVVIDNCVEVVSLAAKAKAKAEKQISEISELFEKKDEAKLEAATECKAAKKLVEAASAVVVQEETHSLLREATKKYAEAEILETQSLKLQDTMLAERLQGCITAYEVAEGKAGDAQNKLTRDETSYEDAIDAANEAVDAASLAIVNAVAKCNHSHAGSAGDYDLAEAKNLLPKKPRTGDTRAEIERIEKAAKSAKKKANEAASAAQTKINSYVEPSTTTTRVVVHTTTHKSSPAPQRSSGGGGEGTRISGFKKSGGGEGSRLTGFKK